MSAERLRFCMPTTFYPPYHFGGDAIAVQRLARALVRAGHEVAVVHDVDAYRALGGKGPSVEEAGSDDQGVSVIRLESRLPRLSTLLTQQTGSPVVHGRQLRTILQPGRFDVVNFHNVSLVGGPAIMHMAADATRIYMAHAHWTVCPTHVLYRYHKELCTGKQCFRCQLSYRRPPQLWRYTGTMRRALNGVDTFIAMSQFSRDKHREFGFPFDMEVLPAFLPEQDPERPATTTSPHPRPYFLFTGRLERIKGVDHLIAASTEYEDADILIAGSGHHEEALRQQAAGNPRIHFLGHVPVDALRPYYENALAVVVPSICFETFGLGLIEAFRSGVPVIARRLGPFPELIAASSGGLLFSTNTELREAMRSIHSTPGLRERLSGAAREAFLEHWTERTVLPAYLDIVQRAGARATVRRGGPRARPVSA